MGIYAAKSSYLVAQRAHLGHAATRLLVFMAIECWDSDDNPNGVKPRRYFGGREKQAIALGYPVQDCATDAANAAVKRAMGELTAQRGDNEGDRIVRTLRHGKFGRTAEYELQVRSDAASSYLVWENVASIPLLPQGDGERPPGATAY